MSRTRPEGSNISRKGLYTKRRRNAGGPFSHALLVEGSNDWLQERLQGLGLHRVGRRELEPTIDKKSFYLIIIMLVDIILLAWWLYCTARKEFEHEHHGRRQKKERAGINESQIKIPEPLLLLQVRTIFPQRQPALLLLLLISLH